MRLLIIMVLLAVVVAVGGFLIWVGGIENRLSNFDRQGCRRGNVVRADRLIDTRDPDDTPAERVRVKAIFPLLDCPATAASQDGLPVLLAPEEADRYIDLVEQARLPIVESGRVVGSQPFQVARGRER